MMSSFRAERFEARCFNAFDAYGITLPLHERQVDKQLFVLFNRLMVLFDLATALRATF